MTSQIETNLVRYLQEELAIPHPAIAMGLRHTSHDLTQLPIVLWQYGLVTLNQLEQILDQDFQD